jgi:hypothetical protein
LRTFSEIIDNPHFGLSKSITLVYGVLLLKVHPAIGRGGDREVYPFGDITAHLKTG